MQRAKGFSLIELMVVLLLMSLLMTIVGPFATQSLNRVQAKSELIELKQWLKKQQAKAFLQGKIIRITLDGNVVMQSDSAVATFKFLSFPAQSITIGANGFIDEVAISYELNQKQDTIQLRDE